MKRVSTCGLRQTKGLASQGENQKGGKVREPEQQLRRMGVPALYPLGDSQPPERGLRFDRRLRTERGDDQDSGIKV